MLAFAVSISSGQRVPYWPQQQRIPGGIRRGIECQTEILEHITVLEQATMGVLKGYLSGPLYYRDAHEGVLARDTALRAGTACAASRHTHVTPLG